MLRRTRRLQMPRRSTAWRRRASETLLCCLLLHSGPTDGQTDGPTARQTARPLPPLFLSSPPPFFPSSLSSPPPSPPLLPLLPLLPLFPLFPSSLSSLLLPPSSLPFLPLLPSSLSSPPFLPFLPFSTLPAFVSARIVLIINLWGESREISTPWCSISRRLLRALSWPGRRRTVHHLIISEVAVGI